MLVQFGDTYGHVLRLAAILLLIPLDTSECERIFSLMNNVKTADRSRLSQANLRNLMLWQTTMARSLCFKTCRGSESHGQQLELFED